MQGITFYKNPLTIKDNCYQSYINVHQCLACQTNQTFNLLFIIRCSSRSHPGISPRPSDATMSTQLPQPPPFTGRQTPPPFTGRQTPPPFTGRQTPPPFTCRRTSIPGHVKKHMTQGLRRRRFTRSLPSQTSSIPNQTNSVHLPNQTSPILRLPNLTNSVLRLPNQTTSSRHSPPLGLTIALTGKTALRR